jgi:hypothetical protein
LICGSWRWCGLVSLWFRLVSLWRRGYSRFSGSSACGICCSVRDVGSGSGSGIARDVATTTRVNLATDEFLRNLELLSRSNYCNRAHSLSGHPVADADVRARQPPQFFDIRTTPANKRACYFICDG